MFERVDDNASRILQVAQHLAREYMQASVDTDHLCLALLGEDSIHQLLESLQIPPDQLSSQLRETVRHDDRRPPNAPTSLVSFTPRLRRILELSWLEASSLEQDMISEVHLLLGIVKEGKSRTVNLFTVGRTKSDPGDLLKELYAELGNLADQRGDTELARLYYRKLYLMDAVDTRIPKAYLHLLKETGKAEKAALSRFDQYSIIDESEVLDDSTVTFDAVAGIDNANSEYYRVMRLFELVFLYPEQYRELAGDFGIANTGTILLFGPTGVGKTFICKAMAGEFSRRTGKKLAFINARLSSVMDKWVGNTEKNITKLIEIALEKSPSLLVLDEIDSLGGERTYFNIRDYKVDWVNHLLVELDRLKNSRKASLVVACTNAIDRVDIALRRRLGTPIIIPLPDQATRAQVFRLYIEKVAASVRGTIDYNTLAEVTVGFTPSDIEEVVQETINRVWLEIVDVLAKNSQQEAQKRLLNTDDFLITRRSKTPSVPISRWVKDSVDHLRVNGDESLAQRLIQAFKGYYALDDFFSQARALPGKKWFVQKI